eukprot:TRINITY_DN1013_c0_g1_i1.p1 TRINITY_DN1013_c0_g1~~TRINITY_DN1013_c0_g1_i1.p1  ORF type:complete len:211 (-),score=47.81 TRINITY_DN1013_c0_g1_i1:528-1160(-)
MKEEDNKKQEKVNEREGRRKINGCKAVERRRTPGRPDNQAGSSSKTRSLCSSFFFFSSSTGGFSCFSFLPSSLPPFPFVFVLCAADGDQNESKSERQKTETKTPPLFVSTRPLPSFFESEEQMDKEELSSTIARPRWGRRGKRTNVFQEGSSDHTKDFSARVSCVPRPSPFAFPCSNPSSLHLFLEEETKKMRGSSRRKKQETRDKHKGC